MMARRRQHDDLAPRSRRRRNLRPIILVLFTLMLGLLAYWYTNPQSAPGWLRDYVPQAPARLYKWKDQQGQLQYSNQPPPEGTDYELVDYWENANVIPNQPAR